MKNFITIVFIILIPGIGLATEGLSIGIGQSRDGIDIYRVSLQKEFEKRLIENRILSLNNYLEVSSNFWLQHRERISGLAVSPVFKFRFNLFKNRSVYPYAELGVGLNYNSRTVIKNRNLSTKLLFEDRIGAGVRLNNVDLSARYMHYSNGDIVMPNEGIDILIFSVSYLVLTP